MPVRNIVLAVAKHNAEIMKIRKGFWGFFSYTNLKKNLKVCVVVVVV
jgi:hypothetical protein